MVVKIRGYTEEDLWKMDSTALRAILHERTHNTIEILIYRILNGKLRKPPNFGNQAKIVLDLWKKRELPTDAPDIQWCIRYVELAEKLNAGETVKLDTELPKPFSDVEMDTVKKLVYGRRSIRQFTDKPVPDDMIKKILFAGLMAPQGVNLGSTRFIVLRDPDEWKLVESNVPIEGVVILVCQDMHLYKTLKFDEHVMATNPYYDAAAAVTQMLLMAHALGLGACWLTHGEATRKRIREYFELPENLVTRIHIVVGWPDEAPIKSQKMSLEDAIITKKDDSYR